MHIPIQYKPCLMPKFILFFGLILFAQSGILAQCLTLPLCPTASQTFCDTTANDFYYWNDSTFYDSLTLAYNLGETPTNLSMQIIDSCGAADVQVSFILLLDLNGDGIRETAISSDSLPSAGLIYYGNAANPNYAGGEAKFFDTRDVPINHKYIFALEKTVQDSLVTVRVSWTNAANPNDYLLPELPYGAHRIEWRFEKNGEIKTCGYNFVVKDCQPPTVTCVSGFPVNIMPTSPSALYLWATDFFPSTSLPNDNYSPTDFLKFAMRRSGTSTGFPMDSTGQPIQSLLFNCSDLGTQPLEIWVKDLAGNVSYCETYIIIQDNFGTCSDPGISVNVCAVNYCNTLGIEDVTFELQGSDPGLPPFNLPNNSDSSCFSMNGQIPILSNFTITPTNDNNPLNGVTTYDLVLISRHILAVEPLGSPYKIIAADANKNGSVTAFDLVELRKLILGIYQELPNNTSWRFVDSSFVFPNPSNPFQTTFPENISVSNIQNNMTGGFFGIKIGDVNCTALANFTTTPSEEVLIIPDSHLQANEIVEVPIRFSQAAGYQGFQFGLHFDPSQVEVLEVMPEVGTKDNFGLFSDHVNVSWSDINTALFLPDAPVFYLRIKALAPIQLADVFSIATDNLHAEAYSENDSPVNLRLQFATTTATENTITQQIFDPTPNPTRSGVRIPLRLEESEIIAVEILDVTGRVVYQQKQVLAAGAHLIELPAIAFPKAGVYIWRVQAGITSKTGKIVKQ